eukprot:jgi/Tetstr1/439376/TSEL_027811.t1
MHAADAADICENWKADSQHGKKGKLQDKLRKEMGQFRPDSGTAVLPEGRVLVKRVEQIVRAWSAGDARKSKDGLNCSMWHALLPRLCAEDALQKGEAGYKQWSELREYLFLVGWVGADLPDGHPLQPDEAVTETVEGYLEMLPKFSEALPKLEINAETADKGKKKKAKEGALKDAHGLAIERLAQGLGNRPRRQMSPSGTATIWYFTPCFFLWPE